MPTNTRPAPDPQRYLLGTVRESQAAVIDTIRTWTTISQQLTRTLRLPVPDVDLVRIVDRAFDVAEQALAAQRQLARTLAGVTTRQLEAVETTVREGAGEVEDLVEAAEDELEQPDRERREQPQAAKGDAVRSQPARQERRPDRRTYEERSVEELRERAGELQIEGRSAMTKDELIAALRQHSR